ncbi:MAG: IS630 family transposase, partial [Treponema sp.]|nr:IS630 family transposase [Treponema sp.]
ILSRQCLNRRMAGIEEMRDEVAAWVTERNSRKTTIRWQFTTPDARIKLQHLYPQI